MIYRKKNEMMDGMRSTDTQKGLAASGTKPDEAFEDLLDGPLPAG